MSGWLFAFSTIFIALVCGFIGGFCVKKTCCNEQNENKEIRDLLISIENDIDSLSNKYEYEKE